MAIQIKQEQPQASDKLLMVFGIAIVLFVFVLLLLIFLGKPSAQKITNDTNATTPAVEVTNQTSSISTSPFGSSSSKTPVSIAGKPIYGASNPKVLLVVFDDFQCPFCSRFHPSVKQALSDHPSSLGLVIKNFPLSIHENARKAAEAYECALDQGNEFGLKMADTLFLSQSDLSESALKSYAKNIGLDPIKFDSCLASGVKASLIETDYQEGISLGVSGTPTSFIGNQKIVGAQPYSVLKQAIDAELVKATAD